MHETHTNFALIINADHKTMKVATVQQLRKQLYLLKSISILPKPFRMYGGIVRMQDTL